MWVDHPSIKRPPYGSLTGEKEFSIVKDGGGIIKTGDKVLLRINSGTGETFYFCISEDQTYIGGYGTTPFQNDTTFIVEFHEVRVNLRLRPDKVDCQLCSTVTVTVTSAATGQSIEGAIVVAEGVSDDHPFSGITDRDGKFKLIDPSPEAWDCVPAGKIRLKVTADRHQPKTIDPVIVPAEGGVDVPIELDCTEVTVQVVDDSIPPQPFIGVNITLTEPDGTSVLGLTNGRFNWEFTFKCVPYGNLTVSSKGALTSFTMPNNGVA